MHRILEFLGPALVTGALSYALTPLARRVSLRVGAVDRPEARKVHRQPIPRLGGVAVIAAVSYSKRLNRLQE